MFKKEHTSCKECAFAIYKDIEQVGCRANMLEKFRADGQVVESYDEEKEFFVINGCKCLYYRPKNWKGQPKDARKEMQLIYQLMVICNDSLEDTVKTLKSVLAQSIPAIHIDVVKPSTCKLTMETVSKECWGEKVSWREIINPDYDKLDSYLQLCLTKPAPFFGVFSAGTELPQDTFKVLEDKVIDDLFMFEALLPDQHCDGVIMNTAVWQYGKFTGRTKREFSIIQYMKDNDSWNNQHKISSILPTR